MEFSIIIHEFYVHNMSLACPWHVHRKTFWNFRLGSYNTPTYCKNSIYEKEHKKKLLLLIQVNFRHSFKIITGFF